jgi:DNA-binding CsgD family transcriptional regulator
LQKLLEAVARAGSTRELKLRIMDEAPALFGDGALGLYLFGPDRQVNEVHTRGVRDGFILTYEQMGRGHDPILEHALGTGEATHDGTIFRGDDWKRSSLYRECGGPWLIRHYLCVPITSSGELVGTLNVGRRSEDHPFTPRDTARATMISRMLAERLSALSRQPERDSDGSRLTIEQLARLRAERVRVRMNAAALEERGSPLGAEQASALWDDVAAGRVAPLDFFDEGERTYVLLPAANAAPPAPRRPLAPREAEVVRRAAAGLANKEIAFELGVSLNTVGSALASAKHKLGVASRVKLVEMARRLGL